MNKAQLLVKRLLEGGFNSKTYRYDGTENSAFGREEGPSKKVDYHGSTKPSMSNVPTGGPAPVHPPHPSSTRNQLLGDEHNPGSGRVELGAGVDDPSGVAAEFANKANGDDVEPFKFNEYDHHLSSSSHVKYDNQEDKWEEAAASHGMTLQELAKKIGTTDISWGIPGIEGLWELTKEPSIFGATDYAMAKNMDQLAFSYYYGDPTRANAFFQYASMDGQKPTGATPEMMASSLANYAEHLFSGITRAKGNIVTFGGNLDHDDEQQLEQIIAHAKALGHFDIVKNGNTLTVNPISDQHQPMHQPMESMKPIPGLGRE